VIELFSAPTPNGTKITIMLEEISAEYKISLVNLKNNEQFNSEFIKISPFSKIPAIIDHKNNKSIFQEQF
jgi:GST-like protein